MAESKWQGVLREGLAGVAGLLGAWGIGVEAWWPEATALLLALFSLVWGLQQNEGAEMLLTVVRKVVSAAGGVALATGLMDPEKVAALTGLLGPLLAALWSWHKPRVETMLPCALGFFLILAAIGSAGCGGGVVLTPDGCALNKVEKDGGVYYAGACFDPSGKVRNLRVRWQSLEGEWIQADIYEERAPVIRYETPDGSWVEWSEKTGVLIGPVPGVVGDGPDDPPPLQVRVVSVRGVE